MLVTAFLQFLSGFFAALKITLFLQCRECTRGFSFLQTAPSAARHHAARARTSSSMVGL